MNISSMEDEAKQFLYAKQEKFFSSSRIVQQRKTLETFINAWTGHECL